MEGVTIEAVSVQTGRTWQACDVTIVTTSGKAGVLLHPPLGLQHMTEVLGGAAVAIRRTMLYLAIARIRGMKRVGATVTLVVPTTTGTDTELFLSMLDREDAARMQHAILLAMYASSRVSMELGSALGRLKARIRDELAEVDPDESAPLLCLQELPALVREPLSVTLLQRALPYKHSLAWAW
jgi:hypothetical protein